MIIDKKFVARHRLRFTLGSGIIGTFFFVINLLTFAKVWESTFNFYSIPIIVIYIGLPAFYIFTCWGVGYVYDTGGFWKEETSHANKEINPEFSDMISDIKYIKKMLSNK